jgi:hypothetical protein
MSKLFKYCIILFVTTKVALGQPINDNFAKRSLIASIPSTVSGDTTGSTSEIGDPVEPYTIWWRFTPQENGFYYLSGYPDDNPYFEMHVYTGSSLNTLVRQNGTRISGTPVYTRIEKFSLQAGVEYSILVGSTRNWQYGPITLKLTKNAPPSVNITSPVANSTVIFGTGQLSVSVNASDSDGSIRKVDYYLSSLIGPLGDPVATSTVSPFSATINLPQGIHYQDLKAVASDNDGASSESAVVRFFIKHYLEQDDFADRKVIEGEKIIESGDNERASFEDGEPSGGTKSIWWSWTAPSTKQYVINCRGWPGGFSPQLDVYTGSSLASLTSIASNSDNNIDGTYSAKVILDATVGQAYVLRVTRILGLGGKMNLSILPRSSPGTKPVVDRFTLANDGTVELLIFSNRNGLSTIQSSPDLKSWSDFGTLPEDGYFSEKFQRPANPSYFFRVVNKP